jgi:3(or 17)beta-hydroxysteroid dehydrogenase
MKRLKDKTVLITGAAGSVGAAAAEAVRSAGGIAITTDVVKGDGIDHVLDVTAEADWTGVVAAIELGIGSLDGLINAAGLGAIGNIEDTDLTAWRRVMAVNLDGAFLGCKHAMPLLKRKGGAIVNVSSAFGLVADAKLVAYTASKAGLIQLTKSVALFGAGLKPPVRCNAVCPAYLEGPMVDAIADATPYPEVVRKNLALAIPLARFGQPSEVASMCVYLLSDEAAFVTGSAITIDGGVTAR